MSLRGLSMTGVVFLAEIRSGLRDRHVVVYSLIVPVFLYPALFWALAQWMTYQEGAKEKQISRVHWEEDAGRFLPVFFDSLAADERFEHLSPGLPEEAVALGDLDASIRAGSGEGGEPEIRLVVDLSRDRSRSTAYRLEEIGKHLRLEMLRERLRPHGETLESIRVLRVGEENLASPEEMGRFILSLILPMILVFMLSMGAMYPAIDALVGEKERRTLETLLASGAPRMSIVAGKFLAVLAASTAALIANLISMIATLAHQVRFFGEDAGVSIGLPWGALPVILAGGILLGAFFSASMILIASFARTFKEGQGYITPFYLVTIIPVVAGTVPGLELGLPTAWIPLLNVVLLFRSALHGTVSPAPAAVVFLSLFLYLAVVLFLARRVFGREEFVVAGTGGRPLSWKRLLFRGGSSTWRS